MSEVSLGDGLRLRVENITTNAFADGHAQIHIQSNPRNPDPRIVLIFARKKSIVMMMMAVTVTVTHMTPRLRRLKLNILRHC